MPPQKSEIHRTRGILLLLLAALLWSLGGVLIKSVSWHPLAIAGVRSAFCAITLVLLGGRIPFTWSLWEIGGGVAYATTVLLLVLATKLTTAANAIFLQYTAPISIAILAPWILKEKTRGSDFITILIVLGGMALFFVDEVDLSGFLGNAAGIVSGVSFGLMTVLLRHQRDASPLASLVIGNVLAAIVGLAFVRAPFPEPGAWLILAVLGVVQLGLPYFILTKAIRHVTAMEACLIPMIEPILNPLWVLLLIGERPGPYSLIGGAVVLGGVTLRAILAVRRDPVHPPLPARPTTGAPLDAAVGTSSTSP
ncbi:MAG: EamA family transporter [Opitutaceae bacterium]